MENDMELGMIGLRRMGTNMVPRGKAVAVFCGSGYWASIAASFLKREGYDQVTNLVGGMTAWKGAGLPMANGSAVTCRA